MSIHIPLSSPDLTDHDRQCVLDVLTGQTLSLGPSLTAFEQAITEATGSRFAVAVNSGTSGLHLCVKAAELGEGDEVITTPFSFVASANCLLYERAVPRFIDIDQDTYNLDVSRIEQHINPRTKGILPVHVFGRPCDMESIGAIASRNGLHVIEDACEAIGARLRGRCVGTFGHTGVFAFYPNKQITTGEGGVIITDDEKTARLCRSWRNQGRGENGSWLQHDRLGYNYRLSDINCALGIAQLSRLSEILARRQAAACKYTELLSDLVPQVIPPVPAAENSEISWFVYVVRLRDDFSREDRDHILDLLHRQGVGCSDYFAPIHLQPFYRDTFGYREGDFPVAEHVSQRTIALPFFSNLTDQQIELVCRVLARAVAAIRHRSVLLSSSLS
jgi:perosamine synthetase